MLISKRKLPVDSMTLIQYDDVYYEVGIGKEDYN